MKKVFMVISSLIFGHLSQAQLANTSWSGYFNIPDPTKMIVEFKVDTLMVKFADQTSLESMSYQISNDTMSIIKIEGQSPCDITYTATYKISLKGNKLLISPIHDECDVRASAWPSSEMEKIE